jgi:photosynthetic reaction center cytochrome c subunit
VPRTSGSRQAVSRDPILEFGGTLLDCWQFPDSVKMGPKSRRYCFYLAFFVLVAILLAASPQNGPESAANSRPTATVPVEQFYKNVQVLKGVPSDQLIPAMQFITAALGVECGFCHVENHFDQDDKKPKQTARKMMQMVMAINQSNFEGQRKVTCNTCHRGSRAPVAIPTIDEAPAMLPRLAEPDEQLPQNLPGAVQLIDKYVQALGGANAIQRVSTRVETGRANFAGREVPVEVFDKTPDKRVSITHLPDGDSITTFDGLEGWLTAPHRPLKEMPRTEIDAARMDADLQFPLHLKQLFGDFRSGRLEKIGDREAYQLIAERAGRPSARLYFDMQSGLLVRVIRYSDSPLGLNPTRIDYADYRGVDGVLVPYRVTIARPAGQFTVQATEIKQNVPIDDTKFVKPAQLSEDHAH